MIADDLYRQVTEITWWGSGELDYMDPPTFQSWVIIFYADDNGLPGEIIHTETIASDDVAFLATGEYNMDGGAEYQQTAQLATPLTLSAHTTYWLSIGAVYAESDDGYRWSLNYLEGDGVCARDTYDSQGFLILNDDLAFVLVAESVGGSDCPEAGAHGDYCSGDIDGSADCVVNLADLAEMLRVYGTCPDDPRYNAEADIAPDGNPCIDLADLAALLGQYGDDCN